MAPLEADHDYTFTGNISVYGSDNRSNQDGTQSITFKAQFTDGVSLGDGGQTILAKSKLSQSQMLRKECLVIGVDYERLMTFIRRPDKLREIIGQMERE